MKACGAFIPDEVLERLARQDQEGEVRPGSLAQAEWQQSRVLSAALRQQRATPRPLGEDLSSEMPHAAVPAAIRAPEVRVFDCAHRTQAPGEPLAPSSADPAAQRVFKGTQSVALFFLTVFGRNSVDDRGMALCSSIHYGRRYNNAMWDGTQMIYGDGDKRLFLDFTLAPDVMGHEIMHGVTQHVLHLAYAGDAGGLNESLSDVFGAMFRQWRLGHGAEQADWVIGSEVLGPVVRARGHTCLRDMLTPDAPHALSRQPVRYDQLQPGMDPHLASGPPNRAFALACRAAGGPSWETIGPIWYQTLLALGPRPALGMPEFARRSREIASLHQRGRYARAVDLGWRQVGL